MVGGAVKKGIYGQFPTVALNTAEDVGSGRLLPTTAVVQYASTLATWFGVPDAGLADALPGIGNFGSHNLGFLA